MTCPDSVLEDIFQPSDERMEAIPLLSERIAILREVGTILCSVSGLFSVSEYFNEHHARNLMDRTRDYCSVFMNKMGSSSTSISGSGSDELFADFDSVG